jgi:5-methylcytosine-specific restriction endonuclease McrA
MTAILLLNADASPLHTVSLGRAISLLVNNKVDVVETGDGLLRSAYTSQPMPSVIRLRYYVRVPRRHAVWSRRAVFSRDSYKCVYCGASLTRETATLDHLTPKEKCKKMGIPASTWSNSVTACGRCNSKKANRSLEDSGMKFKDPRFIAKTPRANYMIVSSDIPLKWKAYIQV